MPVITNLIAFGMVLASCSIGLVITLLVGLKPIEIYMVIFAGPIVTMMDLHYRRRYGNKQFFASTAGGHIYFIPMWIMGFVYVLLGSWLVILPR